MKIIPPKSILLLLILILMPHVLHASEIFSVQAGAFSSKNNAQNIMNVLQNQGIQCTIYDQKHLYKVYCGEFSRKSEANALRRKISSLGYDAFVIPKTLKSPQDIPKADIPAEQPTEAPRPEEPETEQTISPPVTPSHEV